MFKSDVLVVGASAVGGMLAKELALKGVSVNLLEEHSIPGKFHKCSGIMSKKGLESLGVDLTGLVYNNVRGATFFAGKQEFKLHTSETKALIIDRQKFDERVVSEAQQAGAKLFLNSRAESFQKASGSVKTLAKGNVFDSKFLAGCDGANSIVAKAFDFPQIKKFVMGFEVEFSNLNAFDKHNVSVFFDSENFKDFFGWLIPVNGESARIGFATSKFEDAQAGKKFLLSMPQVKSLYKNGDIANCKTVREFFHIIPIAVREKTQMENVMLCGDAGGMTKPTTGGGVVFGGKIAKVCAEEISNSLEEGTVPNYEYAWRKKYGGALKHHEFLRNFAKGFNNSIYSSSLFVARHLRLDLLLSKFGDMDFILSKS